MATSCLDEEKNQYQPVALKGHCVIEVLQFPMPAPVSAQRLVKSKIFCTIWTAAAYQKTKINKSPSTSENFWSCWPGIVARKSCCTSWSCGPSGSDLISAQVQWAEAWSVCGDLLGHARHLQGTGRGSLAITVITQDSLCSVSVLVAWSCQGKVA